MTYSALSSCPPLHCKSSVINEAIVLPTAVSIPSRKWQDSWMKSSNSQTLARTKSPEKLPNPKVSASDPLRWCQRILFSNKVTWHWCCWFVVKTSKNIWPIFPKLCDTMTNSHHSVTTISNQCYSEIVNHHRPPIQQSHEVINFKSRNLGVLLRLINIPSNSWVLDWNLTPVFFIRGLHILLLKYLDNTVVKRLKIH